MSEAKSSWDAECVWDELKVLSNWMFLHNFMVDEENCFYKTPFILGPVGKAWSEGVLSTTELLCGLFRESDLSEWYSNLHFIFCYFL